MRMRIGLGVAATILGVCAAQAIEPQVVADFNMPPPNNLGGGYGVFAPSEIELTYLCTETVDETTRRGDKGASMCLDYNVAKSGAFNGFWIKLGPEHDGNNFDAREYKTLSFWIKGDRKAGVPKKLKVEVKGYPGTPFGRYYVEKIGDDWTKIQIPLKDIAQQRVDLSKLDEIVLVFEERQCRPGTKGRIWIDDFVFE